MLELTTDSKILAMLSIIHINLMSDTQVLE